MTIVRYTTPTGAEVFVETGPQPAVIEDGAGQSPTTRRLRPGTDKAVVAANDTLESALAKVRPAIDAVSDLMHKVAPEEWEVTFGIDLSVQAGALIARTSVAANFQVRMSWHAAPTQKGE